MSSARANAPAGFLQAHNNTPAERADLGQFAIRAHRRNSSAAASASAFASAAQREPSGASPFSGRRVAQAAQLLARAAGERAARWPLLSGKMAAASTRRRPLAADKSPARAEGRAGSVAARRNPLLSAGPSLERRPGASSPVTSQRPRQQVAPAAQPRALPAPRLNGRQVRWPPLPSCPTQKQQQQPQPQPQPKPQPSSHLRAAAQGAGLGPLSPAACLFAPAYLPPDRQPVGLRLAGRKQPVGAAAAAAVGVVVSGVVFGLAGWPGRDKRAAVSCGGRAPPTKVARE